MDYQSASYLKPVQELVNRWSGEIKSKEIPKQLQQIQKTADRYLKEVSENRYTDKHAIEIINKFSDLSARVNAAYRKSPIENKGDEAGEDPFITTINKIGFVMSQYSKVVSHSNSNLQRSVSLSNQKSSLKDALAAYQVLKDLASGKLLKPSQGIFQTFFKNVMDDPTDLSHFEKIAKKASDALTILLAEDTLQSLGNEIHKDLLKAQEQIVLYRSALTDFAAIEAITPLERKIKDALTLIGNENSLADLRNNASIKSPASINQTQKNTLYLLQGKSPEAKSIVKALPVLKNYQIKRFDDQNRPYNVSFIQFFEEFLSQTFTLQNEAKQLIQKDQLLSYEKITDYLLIKNDINFALAEHVIDFITEQDLKELFKIYKLELQEFKKSTNLENNPTDRDILKAFMSQRFTLFLNDLSDRISFDNMQVNTDFFWIGILGVSLTEQEIKTLTQDRDKLQEITKQIKPQQTFYSGSAQQRSWNAYVDSSIKGISSLYHRRNKSYLEEYASWENVEQIETGVPHQPIFVSGWRVFHFRSADPSNPKQNTEKVFVSLKNLGELTYDQSLAAMNFILSLDNAYVDLHNQVEAYVHQLEALKQKGLVEDQQPLSQEALAQLPSLKIDLNDSRLKTFAKRLEDVKETGLSLPELTRIACLFVYQANLKAVKAALQV